MRRICLDRQFPITLVQFHRLFGDVQREVMRRLRLGQCGADLEDSGVSRHLRLQHGFLQLVDRRGGIAARSETLDGLHKEIVAGGEDFVAA